MSATASVTSLATRLADPAIEAAIAARATAPAKAPAIDYANPSAATAPARAAAAAAVTPEQVRQFIEQGYLVIPGLVSPAEIETLKQDTAALARGKYPCKSLKPMPAEYTDDEVQQRLLCIHQPHHLSPTMREFSAHPGIAGVLSRIVGAHIPFWDGSVKCMQSMLFIKPPGKQGQAWHQDELYIPTRDRSLCGAWIAIDDANAHNGCLGVIPGSHRSGYLWPQDDHGKPEEFDSSQESQGIDASGEKLVEVKSGSVVFFNGYLLHRSKKNRSEVYRRALVCHYMNAWSLLPWQTPGTHVGTADFRTVETVSGHDPYAWKGYTATDEDVYLRTAAGLQF
jgi:hypothetical protein